MTKIVDIICENCGKLFQTNRLPRSYCDRNCKIEAAKKRKNKGIQRQNADAAAIMIRLRDQGWSYIRIGAYFNKAPQNVYRTVVRWKRANGQNNQDKSNFS